MLLVLTSCATPNTRIIEPTPVSTYTQVDIPIVPSPTSPPSTPVPSTSTPTHTPIVEPACDPFLAEFCIGDGHFIFQRPIYPPGNDRIDPSYRYASTASGTRDPHHGVEFANASGTPVHAAGEGTIVFAGPDEAAIYAPWPNYYGNLVVIEHAEDLFTLYAHLSKVEVQAGWQVLSGDKIGEVGRTGTAIGSHLHFEVRQGNVEDYFATQNPELWLIPPLDENGTAFGVLEMSIVGQDQELVTYADFTLQHYPDPNGPVEKSFYGTTYTADLLHGRENAVLGELPAGHYRIVVDVNGQFYERRVEVESGRRTQVVFVVN
ncbi:MAG: M23 family metallopeptidase [Chloroflexota bacterium]|nr:M23 family metallopeptidase [Chloroflexota bacterium]